MSSDDVYINFANSGDWMRNSRPLLESVINAGLRTIIYDGDVVCFGYVLRVPARAEKPPGLHPQLRRGRGHGTRSPSDFFSSLDIYTLYRLTHCKLSSRPSTPSNSSPITPSLARSPVSTRMRALSRTSASTARKWIPVELSGGDEVLLTPLRCSGHEVPAYTHGTLDVGQAAFQMFSQIMTNNSLLPTDLTANGTTSTTTPTPKPNSSSIPQFSLWLLLSAVFCAIVLLPR